MLTNEQREEIEHALRWLQPQMTAHRILTGMLSRESAAPAEGRGNTQCAHADEPKACYRVRCQLGDKCVDDGMSPRATAPTKAAEGQKRDDTGRLTSDYEPTAHEIQVARQAICREFGNNGTDGYYIRILKAIHGAATTMSEAARDVLAERRRQVEIEGWTPDHDDEHDAGEMALAGAAYAAHAITPNAARSLWPWLMKWWKPTTPRRNLVKAAALILAEIERIDRAAAKEGA